MGGGVARAGRSSVGDRRSELHVRVRRLDEAIISGTPVVASRIPAAVSALGRDYRGYFRAGDTEGLAPLLGRAEDDPAFLARLARQVRARRPLFLPSAENERGAPSSRS